MQNVLHKLVYNNPEHFTLPVDPTMKIVENNSQSFVNILASNFFRDFFLDFFFIVVRCIQRWTDLNLSFCPWRVYTEQRWTMFDIEYDIDKGDVLNEILALIMFTRRF